MRSTQKALCLVVTIIALILSISDAGPRILTASAQEKGISEQKISKPLLVKVKLERVYVDGEVSQETVPETIWSMEEFWAKYEQWELIDIERKEVIFRKHIDDISPLLKANGYFGITDDGILTIYNGRPQKYNIIQSFFQIDVGKLESTKHMELKQGIPIKNKDRYMEVLESFKNYSKQEKLAN